VNLPFTSEQFFDVFRRYNEAVWPAQIALNLIGAFVAMAAWRANARRSWAWARAAFILLAALWLWTGIVYFKMFFASITPAGQIFGSLFIAQAGLLLLSAWQDGDSFEPATRSNMGVAASIIAYALLLYPMIGMALGQQYPAVPTFGAPCPLVIFTFGVFCLLPASTPRFAIAVPLFWAVVSSYAALGFGVHEDLGLVVAAIAAIVVIHHATHRTTAAPLAV
jgi:hypothetical protein